MKKTFKCLFCIVLTLLLAASSVPFNGITQLIPAVNAQEYVFDKLTYTITDGKAELTSADYDISGIVTLPSTVEGYPLVAVAEDAFADCSALKSIEIPDSVTSIGASAFECCFALESIKLPAKLTAIADNTFTDCQKLKTIELPDKLKTIGKEAFAGCDRLQYIVIPYGVKSIGATAFCWCSSLEYVVIGDTVETIGSSAFAYCDSLKFADLPNNLTRIETALFGDCSSLEGIMIPPNVKSIGPEAFAGCASLAEVSIPKNVVKIEENAFSSCKSLEVVMVWNSKAEICNDFGTFPEHTIVAGYKNSTAHKYVKSNGGSFAEIDDEVIAEIKNNLTAAISDGLYLAAGTTVAQFKKNVTSNIAVFDKNWKSLAGKDVFKTGSKIVLMNAVGEIIDVVFIIVPGDVDCDGQVKAADARSALRAAVGLDKLAEYEKIAADVIDTSEKHTITSADARYILRLAVGLESIADWIEDINKDI